jgi:hypothetical protein
MDNCRVPATIRFLLVLFSFFLSPLSATAQQQTTCKNNWGASFSADETWDASQWTDIISVYLPPNTFDGEFINSAGDTIDFSLNTYTGSGDQALVGILNISQFFQQNPNLQSDVLDLQGVCGMPTSSCSSALQNFGKKVSDGELKAAATWWHGCRHSSDNQTYNVNGLSGQLGYLVGGQTKGGSDAVITGTYTIHANPPQSHTETITGPYQTGTMPPPGQYTNKLVGHLTVILPQHSGMLSNISYWISALTAKGQFTVDVAGNIRFSGDVSFSNCPRPLPPQHTILKTPLPPQ